MKTKNLLKKAFLLLALMGGATSAWADVTYYTPEADEVIILNDVYNSDATNAGYSNHTAIQWGGTVSFSDKTCGDPANAGAATSSSVKACSVKGNGKGKNLDVIVTGVTGIIVYHESHGSRYIQVKNGDTVVKNGNTSTYYTEVTGLDGSTDYTLRVKGTGSGTDDQDLYVYAIKLIKYGASKTPSDLTITSGTTLLLEKNATSTITHTTSSTGAITYISADGAVATVTNAGVITAKGGGKTKITVSQASDETYAAGSKVVDVNVPYDNPEAADTYTLSYPELSFSNDAKTKHYFTNGFTITTNAEDGMQYAGIESNTGIKYSHVRTYTINTPSNVTATYLEIKARNNYPTGGTAANWGKVLGTDYSEEALPFSDEEPQTKYFQIASPAAGADLSFSPGGNQWQGYITVHTNAWVAATGVEINKTSTSIGVGRTETLTATLAPATASNQNVSWTSSNTSVATVANGVVTAVAAGSATITATTDDGSFTATCDVTVVLPIVTLPTGSRSGYSCTGSTSTYSRTGHPFNGQSVYSISLNGTITLTIPSTTQISKIQVLGTSDDNSNTSTITITGANSENASGTFVNRNSTSLSQLDFTPTTQTTTYTINSANKASVVQIAIYGTEYATGTITPAGWASFSSTLPLDLSTLTATSGATAYYASASDGSSVTLTETTAKVPANTGLMIKGEPNVEFTIATTSDETTAIDGNLLKATDGSEIDASPASGAGTYHYVFGYESSSVYGFYNLAEATTVPAGKAYLEITKLAQGARSLRISLGGITEVENVEAAPVATVKNGTYLENGKIAIYKNGMKFSATGARIK